MEYNIFTISDIEMGKGDLMDDFHDEQSLIRFIEKISEIPGLNTLILNGDTFDFLKMDYQGEYTRYITETISLWKLEQIFKTHKKVFEALKKFLAKGHTIHFIIGNHDFDLEWPKVQQKLREILNGRDRIFFGHYFQNEDIHVEHGNSSDTFFYFKKQKPFIYYKGKKILNMPFGSYIVIDYLIELKKKFAKEEQIYPRPLAMKLYPDYKKASLKKLIAFSIKGLIIHPIFKFNNPTFRIPYIKLIKHFLKHGLNVTDDRKFLKKHFADLIEKFPQKKAFILGHRHIQSKTLHQGYQCLMTDTWRNEFELKSPNSKSKETNKKISTWQKNPKLKTYAEVNYKNGELTGIDLKIFV